MIFKNPYFFFSFLTVVNFIFYALTLLMSEKRARCYRIDLPKKTRGDFLISLVVLFTNIIIAIPGYLLFLENKIRFVYDVEIFEIIIEFIVLVFTVDILLFIAHGLSHRVPFFRRFHAKHHTHETFNALSLYVMHPAEAAALGILFTVLFFLYTFNIYTLFIFLFFNWFWGVLAHWNIESETAPIFFSNNQFHAIHHRDSDANFGFYTVVFDRILKTFREK